MEVVTMWTAWLLLMLNGLFFTLRLANNTGSFPRALTREEEQNCLKRMAQGDSDARDKLIEHNLRLVAHIVKVIRRTMYACNGLCLRNFSCQR